MYVLRYATVEHAKNAYSYYYGKVDFVAPNIVVHAAEGETSEDAGLANVGAPLDTLEQLGDAKKMQVAQLLQLLTLVCLLMVM